jgi:hypothetical protein
MGHKLIGKKTLGEYLLEQHIILFLFKNIYNFISSFQQNILSYPVG